MTQPKHVFISYSHKDEALVDELDMHLASLKRRGLVTVWKDRAIEAGQEWKDAISAQMDGADIILLVVSAGFIASEFIWKVELGEAMKRHDARTARVIPVIAKPCDWHDMPFAKLQALPRDGKPVASWSDRDTAWTDVVKGISRVVETLPDRSPRAAPAAAPTASPAPAPGPAQASTTGTSVLFQPASGPPAAPPVAASDSALPDDILLEVHQAAVNAGLAGSRDALLAGIDRSIVASLPGAGNLAAQLRTDLDELNRTVLVDGARPLRTWLLNAHRFSSPRVQSRVFQHALDALDARSAAAGASAGPPGPAAGGRSA